MIVFASIARAMPSTSALHFTESIRVVMTWIYLATGGSVLYAALFHGTLNAVSSFVVAGINRSYFNLVYPAGFAVAAATLIVVTRGRLPMRAGSATRST